MRAGSLNIAIHAKDPAQQADRVGFQDWLPLLKGNRQDRSGRVTANTWQGTKLVGITGERAVMLVHDQAGGTMQLTSTPVIAKPLPAAQYRFLAGVSKAGDVRKLCQETVIVGDHLGYLCLLQHHLADPDPVRRHLDTPGQVASVLSIPAPQCGSKSTQVFNIHETNSQ